MAQNSPKASHPMAGLPHLHARDKRANNKLYRLYATLLGSLAWEVFNCTSVCVCVVHV